jgi:5-formyltetrahydrofolate cyclo-ligase
MPDEPDIVPALQACLDRGVRIVLPRIDWSANAIVPIAMQVLAPPELVETSLGIREPGPAARMVEAAEIDVVLVPGLAFGPDPLPPGPGGPGGFPRLGKGKGFYDRFLSRSALRAMTLGIALNEQLVHDVPMTSSDVPVMGLATPDSVRWAR